MHFHRHLDGCFLKMKTVRGRSFVPANQHPSTANVPQSENSRQMLQNGMAYSTIFQETF
jgi:hypothetical protein